MSVPQRWRLKGRVLSWGRLTEATQTPCQSQPLDNVWILPVPHGLASLRQDTSEMESGVESSRTKSTVVGEGTLLEPGGPGRGRAGSLG